ncbi:MAG: putative DNA-binding domain-containing protein [Deltaproteobacteria bacterium]|nr:putative DNA-binding domain-containing protein [Deltaproteobacteria bacterium]
MPAEARLLTTQRRFFSALREPIFGDSRGRSELPDREGDVSREFVRTANELILPSALLEPVERLELYHRQYWYRLLDSLAEDFPALRRLLGDKTFWDVIESYVEHVPSRSFTLRHLGRYLGDFVDEHPALAPHPLHAADLARLEYALCEAFEAAEHPALPPAELAGTRIALQPHLRLLALRTPVDTFRHRVQAGRKTAAPRPAAQTARRFVAVFRRGLRLQVDRLPRAAFEILSAIERTGSLDQAMDEVARRTDLRRLLEAARVSAWFADWLGRGWLVRAPANPLALVKEGSTT